MLFLRLNIYELMAAAVFGLAYFGVCLSGRSVTPRFSYLAVFSALSVFLNPILIHLFLMRVHFPYIVGRGDSELRSFLAGLVTLVTGIVAVVRIRKARGGLRGLPFAVFGIVGGIVWAGGWAAVFFRFMWGMSNWM